MGFFYKHIIHPILSRSIGKKALTNNPYLGFVIENEDSAIADELFMVGLAYQYGLYMLPQSSNKAMTYFRKAAERGHAPAQVFMVMGLMRHPDDSNDEVMYWLQKAAEQGERQATYNLGISYHRGDIDGKVDIRKSNELIRASAESGYTEAYSRMATIYLNGDGVEKNLKIAKYWAYRYYVELPEEARREALLNHLIEKGDTKENNTLNVDKVIIEAAKAGERDAYCNWAINLMEEGKKEESLEIMEQGAKLKHPTSMVNVARQLWSKDTKDYQRARRLFEEAILTGNEHAFYGLAVIFYNGLGVDKDLNKAWQYLEKALNLGDNESREFFATILSNNELDDIIPPVTGRAQHYMELASTNGYTPNR